MIDKKAIYPLLIILFISCTTKSDIDYSGHDDVMQAPAILATQSLVINSDENFFFGDIADVKHLSNGSLVVLDSQSLSIHLISEDGNVINSVSLEGNGPGEVQNLSNRIRITKDNYFAIDDYLMYKISIFHVKDEVIKHVDDFALESSISDFILNDKDQLVLKKSTLTDGEESFVPILIVDLDEGTDRRTVREFPAHREITLSGAMGGLNFTINTSTEYHSRNEFCSFGNRLYHIQTDSLGFRIYNLEDGREMSSSIYNLPAERLTTEEKEMEIDRILESGREFWGDSERTRLLSEMPEFKPIVKRVICDLPDGIWLELMSNGEENWVFLSDEGEVNGIYQKNMDGRLVTIHRGNIFISEATDLGDITLKAYHYSISNGF